MIRAREHGDGDRWVAVLHGGPGAPGSAAALARRLGRGYHVLEPLQRGSGDVPLSVARHVADLDQLLAASCGEASLALVGHSWGAMLALAYAAEHPRNQPPSASPSQQPGRFRAVAAIVLVGCGSFDPTARARFKATCNERLGDAGLGAIAALTNTIADPNERLRALANLLLPVYSCDPIADSIEGERCDARAYQETWNDMLRLQEQGVYPAACARIKAPVLMIHGADDPHPGRMIHASLAPFVGRLSYHELARCGHYPWLERSAAEEFYRVVIEWLDRYLADAR